MVAQNQEVKNHLNIIRRKQVESRTGLARSTIYFQVSQGTFPKPILLGARSVGWLEAEVTAWIEQRVKESREKKRGGK
jgi:prophage regulatory protein